MNFGKRVDEKTAEAICERAFHAGISLVDTANAYADGLSEEIVGRIVRKHPGRVLVSTKVGLFRSRGKVEGLSRSAVRAGVEASLRRLRLDRIDVLYLHAPDHAVAVPETLAELAALRGEGKIDAWGISNYAAWQILEMLALAREHGIPPPLVTQALYNLCHREVEVELLPFASRYGLHVSVYNALAGGLLSHKHRSDAPPPQGGRFDKNPMYQRRYYTKPMFALRANFEEHAKRFGVSLVHAAYDFLAAAPAVDSVLLGPSSVPELEEALHAFQTPLGPEARDPLRRAFLEHVGSDTHYVR